MSAYAHFLKVGFSSDGSCAYVRFSFDDGGEECLCLLSEKYASLVRGVSDFSEEEYRNICYEAELSHAVISALRSLSCSPCTKKALYTKLRQKRISHEVSEEAVEYLAGNGYIDERRQIVCEVNACLAKKYGPLKIKSRLISKGYPSKLIERVMLKLEDRDFTPACLEIARKRGLKNPFDAKERSAMYSYLARNGYDSDCIKRVLSILYVNI